MLSSLLIFLTTVAIIASPMVVVPALCWIVEMADTLANEE